jgi:predicted RNase H-like HicB family nuclease
MKKYGFNFFWSEEDKGYIATCPDFPGLSAYGETLEEATQQAISALEGFIHVLETDGVPLPEPTILPEYSGQFRLRLPPTLHGELVERARLENMSLNAYIVYQLAERNAGAKLAKAVLARINIFECKVTSQMGAFSDKAVAWTQSQNNLGNFQNVLGPWKLSEKEMVIWQK